MHKPFPTEFLEDIVSLPFLEILGIDGYAFNDADASVLALNSGLKFIHLKKTAITQKGESELLHSLPGRRVVLE